MMTQKDSLRSASFSEGASSGLAIYIDPPAKRFLQDRLFEVDSLPLSGAQLLAPYRHLKDYLNARGIPIHTIDLLPQTVSKKKNLYISIAQPNGYRWLRKRKDVIFSAFVATECPVVDLPLYRALPKVQKHFKRILSWSDSQALMPFTQQKIKCEPFFWPQSFEQVHEHLWSHQDRQFLVMINANKLPQIYHQELYTERLRALEYFSQTDEIDLFGTGWDQPSLHLGRTWMPYTLRSLFRKGQRLWAQFYPDPRLVAARRIYKGVTSDKAVTLGQYTFAICFENSILKGFITEKIFDCFFSGTIPIYWGAPDIDCHIPADCFIDMRNFETYEALGHYLKSLTKKDILAYRQNAKAYLKSPQFKPFTLAAFADLFGRIIKEDTGIDIASMTAKC